MLKHIAYLCICMCVFIQTQLGVIHMSASQDRCHAHNLIPSKLLHKMKEKCSNLLMLLYTWICSLQRQQNAIKWRLVPYNKAIFPQWSNFQMEALSPKSEQFSLRWKTQDNVLLHVHFLLTIQGCGENSEGNNFVHVGSSAVHSR